MRLFALACCKRIESRLTHSLSRQAMILVERYAEGMVTDEQIREFSHLFAVEYNARLAASGENWSATQTTDLNAAHSMTLKVFPASTASTVVEMMQDKSEERLLQCRLLRCIFGNPFRPITLDPTWLTSTVLALAQQMYDSRDFSPMPILADALQDAGCDIEEILNHCRQPGEHVRGCFVADLLLGKT